MSTLAVVLAVIYAIGAGCLFLVGLIFYATAISESERREAAPLVLRAPLWPLDLIALIAHIAATNRDEDPS